MTTTSDGGRRTSDDGRGGRRGWGGAGDGDGDGDNRRRHTMATAARTAKVV